MEADDRRLRNALLKRLKLAGFQPQEFGVSGIPMDETLDWSFSQAERVMCRCSGAMILVLPRWRMLAENGEPCWLPTEYNHVEGALALAQDLPVLIITTRSVFGLFQRGIIGKGTGKFMGVAPPDVDPVKWLKSDEFELLFDSWKSQVVQRRDVFLGYCGKANKAAQRIKSFLVNKLKVSVLDWSTDFTGGMSILQKIEAASACSLGVFLFTKDDELAGHNKFLAAPRDNVVFEAGYFVHAKGKERTLIIREEGAKVPADLGGDIYLHLQNRRETSTIEARLRQFIEKRL